MKFSPGIPLLRIFSEEKAREFYLDYLGFKLKWEHRFEPGMPLYACIKRSGLTLHLTEHHGDATPGSTVFAPLTGIEEFHAELMAKPYPHMRPGLESDDLGVQFEVIDPFGNRIRFCELAEDS